jgi:hypothetical protein
MVPGSEMEKLHNLFSSDSFKLDVRTTIARSHERSG